MHDTSLSFHYLGEKLSHTSCWSVNLRSNVLFCRSGEEKSKRERLMAKKELMTACKLKGSRRLEFVVKQTRCEIKINHARESDWKKILVQTRTKEKRNSLPHNKGKLKFAFNLRNNYFYTDWYIDWHSQVPNIESVVSHCRGKFKCCFN